MAKAKEHLTDLTTFLEEARRIQSTEAGSGVQFMRFLFLGERHPPLWEGFQSFQQVLRMTSLCPVRRYEDFKAAHSKLTPKQIEAFGVEGSIEIIRIANPDDLKAAVRAVTAWVNDTRTVPNRQRVGAILRQTLTHTHRTSHIRQHGWSLVGPNASWCRHCGSIRQNDTNGRTVYRKPGKPEVDDLPSCIRVRTQAPTPTVARETSIEA